MKAGTEFKLNGIDLLVLTDTADKVFVMAHKLYDKDTVFDNHSNNYAESVLRNKMEKWLKESGITVANPRTITLLNMDGSSYGGLSVDVAPLTYDEYRLYASIIKEHVDHDFWTATGWGDSGWVASHACFVISDGKPDRYAYNYSAGFAPAFVLSKTEIKRGNLADFSIEELLAEIQRRTA